MKKKPKLIPADNAPALLKELVTVKELAEMYGVTGARIGALLKTYGVRYRLLSNRMIVTTKTEARKIPRKRTYGVKQNGKKTK